MQRGEGMTGAGRPTGRAWVLALALVLSGCGSGGSGQSSPTEPAASPPPQATGLTAEAGDGEVALSWTAIAVATRWEYRLRIGDGGWGAWTAVPGSNSATTGHTVTEVANGMAYGFQVRAANAGGAGPASAEATATPGPPVPPAAEGLAAMAGDGLVVLSWTALGEASGWEYRMRIGDGAWGAWTAVPGGGPDTTGHSVTGLENGTAYGFQVRAANASGVGPASTEATATPVPPVPPAAEGLAAMAGDGLVVLSWTALGEASGWEYRMRIGDGAWGAWTEVPGGGPDTTGHWVRGLANGTAYGFQVRAANAGGAGPPSAEAVATPVRGVPVEIPDADLRRVLETALGKAPGSEITDVDMRTLTGLRAPSEGIAGLTGLEHASRLEWADLADNRIVDAEPLGALTNLARLELQGNLVSDPAPLSTLASLAYLDLSGNRIPDVSPIAVLRSLDHLNMSHTGLVDVRPLSNLTSLSRLELAGNEISDLTPLAALSSLTHLELWRNDVDDLSPLAGLASLEHLSVGHNHVVDLRPLADLTSLVTLRLHNNAIEDISALRGLRSLEELTLGPNPVSDVAQLESLTSLRYLHLMNMNAVEDLSFVSGLSKMWFLYISGTSVKDLGPLAGLDNLKSLHIGGTGVDDLSPLAGLTSLRQLSIHDLSVDLRPLAELTSLEYIWQTNWPTGGGRPKVDIEPLAGLVNLTVLAVSPTRGDLSPLAKLDSLVRLRVQEPGTRFENLPALEAMSHLEELTLDHGGLEAIAPMAEIATLRELDLSGNRIEDLAPLAGLTRLDALHLDDNRVRHIAALAANPGLGAGDTISLVGNPLGQDALLTHIPDLESRGASVAYDRDDFPDSPLRILRDEAVSMLVEEDLDTVAWELDLAAYAEEFIAHFGDEFDVLLFVSALARSSDHADLPYYGVYHHVSNEVRGIGLDEDPGASRNASRLKGLIHFPYLRALAHGPSLHELMHMWANYGVKTSYDAHWGFSSADGQLGGFRREALVDLGGGLWSAGAFAENANGGNRVRYSPWELYLGGFVGPEEVPELWVAAEGRWTGERTEAGHSIFEAVEHETLTVDEFVETHGPREPDRVDAPKELRGAVIVLEDGDHRLHHWDSLLEQVRWLSHPGRHAAFRGLHNYHTATGGRGRLVLDGLRELRRETPGGAPSLRLVQVCPPPGMPAGAGASSPAPWTDFARPTLDNGGNRGPE